MVSKFVTTSNCPEADGHTKGLTTEVEDLRHLGCLGFVAIGSITVEHCRDNLDGEAGGCEANGGSNVRRLELDTEAPDQQTNGLQDRTNPDTMQPYFRNNHALLLPAQVDSTIDDKTTEQLSKCGANKCANAESETGLGGCEVVQTLEEGRGGNCRKDRAECEGPGVINC